MKDFHNTWYDDFPTGTNPTTLLLLFYFRAGTTSSPLTFRLVVIFINSEVFTDQNTKTALMCLCKVTELRRFTVIAEVFEALTKGLRELVYARNIVFVKE